MTADVHRIVGIQGVPAAAAAVSGEQPSRRHPATASFGSSSRPTIALCTADKLDSAVVAPIDYCGYTCARNAAPMPWAVGG